MLYPAAFIAIAEETDLIVAIGEWVLREACSQLKAWHDEGYDDLRIAVNLSARQFSDPNLCGLIQSTLETADRKRVGEGKSVSVRVDLGGRGILKNKTIENSIRVINKDD